MYFDKSWNKICNKNLYTYQDGRNNDWPDRDSKLGPLKLLSGALPTGLSATLPVSLVSDPPLSPGEEWTRNPWLEE